MGLLRNLSGTHRPDQSHLAFCSWLTVFDHDGLFVIIFYFFPADIFWAFGGIMRASCVGQHKWFHGITTWWIVSVVMISSRRDWNGWCWWNHQNVGCIDLGKLERARLGSTQVAYLAPRQIFFFISSRSFGLGIGRRMGKHRGRWLSWPSRGCSDFWESPVSAMLFIYIYMEK